MKTILIERLLEISKDTDPLAAIPEPMRQELIEEILAGLLKPGASDLVRANFRASIERELPPGLTLAELSINGLRNTLEQAKELLAKFPVSALSLGQMLGDNAPACFRVGEVRGQVYVMLGIIDMCVDDLKELALHLRGECHCQESDPKPTAAGGSA